MASCPTLFLHTQTAVLPIVSETQVSLLFWRYCSDITAKVSFPLKTFCCKRSWAALQWLINFDNLHLVLVCGPSALRTCRKTVYRLLPLLCLVLAFIIWMHSVHFGLFLHDLAHRKHVLDRSQELAHLLAMWSYYRHLKYLSGDIFSLIQQTTHPICIFLTDNNLSLAEVGTLIIAICVFP